MIKFEEWADQVRSMNKDICFVMGGGTSLVRDLSEMFFIMKERSSEIFYLGVNHHTNILFPHATVIEDEINAQLMQGNDITTILGRHKQAHVDISEIPYWRNGGISACYVAHKIGFKTIILLGFDCFKNMTRWHWHDKVFELSPFDRDVSKSCLEAWEECKEHMGDCENISALSGELCNVFGEFIY